MFDEEKTAIKFFPQTFFLSFWGIAKPSSSYISSPTKDIYEMVGSRLVHDLSLSSFAVKGLTFILQQPSGSISSGSMMSSLMGNFPRRHKIRSP